MKAVKTNFIEYLKRASFLLSVCFLIFIGIRLAFFDTLISFPAVFAKDYYSFTEDFEHYDEDTAKHHYRVFPLCIPNPLRAGIVKGELGNIAQPCFRQCKVVSLCRISESKVCYLLQSKANLSLMFCVTFDVVDDFPYRLENPFFELPLRDGYDTYVLSL